MFGFQQRTNMEINKDDDWLEAIVVSNYETMWLAHGSQVINHMTINKRKRETCLAGQILYMQACGKGMKNGNKLGCNNHDKRMWVRARKREKNKEKCVNGATFLTAWMDVHFLFAFLFSL
jgi:hypothetical protein